MTLLPAPRLPSCVDPVSDDFGVGLYVRRGGKSFNVEVLNEGEDEGRPPLEAFEIGGASLSNLAHMLLVDDVVDAVAEHLCLAGAAALRQGRGHEYEFRTTPEVAHITLEGDVVTFELNGRRLHAPLREAIDGLASAGAAWVKLMRALGPKAPVSPEDLARLEAAARAASGADEPVR